MFFHEKDCCDAYQNLTKNHKKTSIISIEVFTFYNLKKVQFNNYPKVTLLKPVISTLKPFT